MERVIVLGGMVQDLESPADEMESEEERQGPEAARPGQGYLRVYLA